MAQFPEFVGGYRIGSVIGYGSNSQVHLATHVSTRRTVAVKITNINWPAVRQQALKEAAILSEIGNHKNIVRYEGHCLDDNFLYLFTEYASNGDLYSYVKKYGTLDETTTCRLFIQLVEALRFCHARKITHHDLKLENILLSSDLTLKLSDFGIACKSNDNEEFINCFGGSPLYMAPEMFSRLPHDSKVDVWSLAVCLYCMVYGTYPIAAKNYEDLEERILFDEVMFPNKPVSEDLLDLLCNMFKKDPTTRFSISQVRKHRWLRKARTTLKAERDALYNPSQMKSQKLSIS